MQSLLRDSLITALKNANAYQLDQHAPEDVRDCVKHVTCGQWNGVNEYYVGLYAGENSLGDKTITTFYNWLDDIYMHDTSRVRIVSLELYGVYSCGLSVSDIKKLIGYYGIRHITIKVYRGAALVIRDELHAEKFVKMVRRLGGCVDIEGARDNDYTAQACNTLRKDAIREYTRDGEWYGENY